MDTCLGRVTKVRIGEAILAEAAARLANLQKPEMAREAEAHLAGTGRLPPLLRKPVATSREVPNEAGEGTLGAT